MYIAVCLSLQGSMVRKVWKGCFKLTGYIIKLNLLSFMEHKIKIPLTEKND